MPSLDTNCLLRWFLNDVPQQCQAVEALMASPESVYVDDVVIIEAVFAMEKVMKLDRLMVRDFIEAAMATSIVMDRSLWSQVMYLWTNHPKLSVVDVYLAVKTSMNGRGPMYTFDSKMVNQLAGTAKCTVTVS